MKIVIDTNALMLPFRDGIELDAGDAVGHVEWIVPSSVHAELEALAAGDGATARAATGALRLAADMQRIGTELPGDDGVLDVARRSADGILSLDRKVQAEAKRSGLVALFVRNRRIQRI